MKFALHLIALLSLLTTVIHAAPSPRRSDCTKDCQQPQARDVLDVDVSDIFSRARGRATARAAKKPNAPVAVKAKHQANRAKAGVKAGVDRGHAWLTKKGVTRPLTPAQRSHRITQVQSKQTARRGAIATKKAKNAKTVKNIAKPKAASKKTATAKDKQAFKDRGRAIKAAQATDKARKVAKHARQVKSPADKAVTKAAQTARRAARRAGTLAPATPQARKAAKPSRAEKAHVKKAFTDANRKLRATQGLPGNRKDTYTVGPHRFSGKDVRQATFNSYLHKGHPIGQATNRNPKPFANRPYDPAHPDATIAGRRPIRAGNYRHGKEYPIKANSPSGWTGTGPVGAGRVITYKDGKRRHVAVVAHDPSRGGAASDHYVATHTPHTRRELETTFEEDFE